MAHTKSNLVKAIHEKVVSVKQDQKMEVEYMTRLERNCPFRQTAYTLGIEESQISATLCSLFNLGELFD